jgi:Cdc6-like AAA superfamily ATPase
MDENLKKQKLNDLNILKNKISESVRTEKKNLEAIEYIEFNDNLKNISSNSNFIVFGRRGTGKTTLLINLFKRSKNSKFHSIYLDCEMIKKYSYPDIIIFILKRILEDLKTELGFSIPFTKKSKLEWMIKTELRSLNQRLEQSSVQESYNKEEKEFSGSTEVGVAIPLAQMGDVRATSSSDLKGKTTKEFKQVDFKIKYLDQNILKYQKIIDLYIDVSKKERVFILLDDFYFIKEDTQFKLIDYIHKLCKGSLSNFKVATIRHRSKLYERNKDETIGVQSGADFKAIDLDYMLDRPELSEQFMKEILNNLITRSAVKIELEDLFVDGVGLKRLVWASGGVPRDFLNILVYILEEILSESEIEKRIGKDRVNSASVKYYQEKLTELTTERYKDSKVMDLFNWIRDECLDKAKKTAFLIKRNSLGSNGILEMFNSLIDLRLIHLVRKNETLKKVGGELYEAYILDMGVYAGELRLNKNIEEIDIYEKGTKSSDSPFRYKAIVLDVEQFKQNLDVKEQI